MEEIKKLIKSIENKDKLIEKLQKENELLKKQTNKTIEKVVCKEEGWKLLETRIKGLEARMMKIENKKII